MYEKRVRGGGFLALQVFLALLSRGEKAYYANWSHYGPAFAPLYSTWQKHSSEMLLQAETFLFLCLSLCSSFSGQRIYDPRVKCGSQSQKMGLDTSPAHIFGGKCNSIACSHSSSTATSHIFWLCVWRQQRIPKREALFNFRCRICDPAEFFRLPI